MNQFLQYIENLDVDLENIMRELSSAPSLPAAQYTPSTKVPPQKLLSMVECLITQVRAQKERIDELTRPSQGSKKGQILEALMEGPQSITALAEIANTTPRNVSTYLSALRREGHLIGTTGQGDKYL